MLLAVTVASSNFNKTRTQFVNTGKTALYRQENLEYETSSICANTHVDLFDSFQTHQIFSSLFCFPLLTSCLSIWDGSRCFSDFRIQ